MPKKTKAEKIEELEKTLAEYQGLLSEVQKRNQELLKVEEHTFLHSPTYIQMKEQITFLENLIKLDEYNLAAAKRSARKIDASIQQIYDDNKRLTEAYADTEYFVGITENWHGAMDFKKLQDDVLRLQASVEQKTEAIVSRDAEIYRLQMLLAEEHQKSESVEQ